MEDKKETPKGWQRIRENKWFRRFGLLAFLFFLIKGLLWLAVIYFGFQGIKALFA